MSGAKFEAGDLVRLGGTKADGTRLMLPRQWPQLRRGRVVRIAKVIRGKRHGHRQYVIESTKGWGPVKLRAEHLRAPEHRDTHVRRSKRPLRSRS